MQPQGPTSIVLGALMALLGGAVVLMVMAADVGGTPQLEALAMRLGLAFAPLLLAIGLALTLTGLWLIWRARQPPE